MSTTASSTRRPNWANITTVMSAAILIAAEVFGAAFAGGWALAILFNLGDVGAYLLQGAFCLLGLFTMAVFIRNATRAEPFFTRD